MQYKIIVDKQPSSNPSNEIKEYVIDIEELRVKGDIYDSLVITKGEDYVIRRLELTKYHKLNVLKEPIKEPLTDLNIELFEGDNYIYLMDMTGNKFYAEYIVKNDFTDMYVTRNEMNSSINQTASQIELSVNQKLTGYSTLEETKAMIKVEADEITSKVSKKYATKDEMSSSITQTANEINMEVSKKVGNDEVISKINQSAEAVGIQANKIELSANDILNLIAGNAINLTSKNITITSNAFKVDKNGKVTCSDIDITGGRIVLESSEGNCNVIVKGNGSTCELYGDSVSIFEDLDINIPAGVNTFIENGEGGIVAVKRTSGGTPTETRVLASGIETPKLTQTSLKSKKKNIKKFKTNALDLIKNSDICLYNLKGEKAKTKKHIGLVIGEGYNCPDEVISEDGQGIEQYSMTSLAWKAIQEQQEIIEKLNKRIEELEAK